MPERAPSRLFERFAQVFKRPASRGQLQCVFCRDRAHKPAARIFLRAHLKVQRGALSFLEACGTQVGRMSHACFVFFCRVDNAMVVGNRGQFVIDVLLARSFNTFQAVGKFRIFFLQPRKLLVEKRLISLRIQQCRLRLNQLGVESSCQSHELERVSLGGKAIDDGLCTCDGRDGQLNFIEHGSPSDKSVRVEEPAFSCGEGFHPTGEALSQQPALHNDSPQEA